jgi:hypothetical protein
VLVGHNSNLVKREVITISPHQFLGGNTSYVLKSSRGDSYLVRQSVGTAYVVKKQSGESYIG